MPEWKNYGHTTLAGWQASVAAIDSVGEVLAGGPVSLPELDLLERGASPGFEMIEADVDNPYQFELTLTGPFGQSRKDTIKVRRPPVIGEMELDSSFASTVIDYDGRTVPIRTRGYNEEGMARAFTAPEPVPLREGLMRIGQVGAAECRLMDAAGTYDCVERLVARNPYMLLAGGKAGI